MPPALVQTGCHLHPNPYTSGEPPGIKEEGWALEPIAQRGREQGNEPNIFQENTRLGRPPVSTHSEQGCRKETTPKATLQTPCTLAAGQGGGVRLGADGGEGVGERIPAHPPPGPWSHHPVVEMVLASIPGPLRDQRSLS